MDQGEAAWALTSEGCAVQDDGAAPVGFETLYGRLRAICGQRLHSERLEHTLQATALANEVWYDSMRSAP